jgi:hypothetical protein
VYVDTNTVVKFVGHLATQSVVIEFHDPQVDVQTFGEQLGLHYVGTVGVLDWAHEFKLNDTTSSKRSLLWDGVLDTLEALKTSTAGVYLCVT